MKSFKFTESFWNYYFIIFITAETVHALKTLKTLKPKEKPLKNFKET